MVMSITIENPYDEGGYMDDEEDDGYRSVRVEHNGPWSIYTDSGFSKAISEIVGFGVDFTEQGMQEDGMASMEGTMGDAMESIQEGRLGYSDLSSEDASKVDTKCRQHPDWDKMSPGEKDQHRYKVAKEMGLVESKLTEGYESKVISICKDAGIDCSFKDGKMYVAKEDMAKAKKALEDNEDILELPDMIAENVELDRLKHLIGVDTTREMKQ